MSSDDVSDAIMQQLHATARFVIDDVTFAWRLAHARACVAYDHWCSRPSAAAYAQYRAAQDQADSAQDSLQAYHTGTVGFTRF